MLQIGCNPSFPYRLVHKLLASALTVAFLMAGLSAFRWLWNDRRQSIMMALKTGVYLAAVLVPVQILVGDLHGLNTLQYQPAKVAAMEGLWETRSDVPLVLFAVPDEENETNRFELTIPSVASYILKHNTHEEIRGLKDFEDRPPVATVFYSFRIMVGIGFLMLVVSWYCACRLWRHNNLDKMGANSLAVMTFSGWIAVLSGWYVTEVGRQPFLVQDVLRTEDAVTPVSGSMVGLSLALYLVLYVVLLVAYVGTLFYMARGGEKESKIKMDLQQGGVQ